MKINDLWLTDEEMHRLYPMQSMNTGQMREASQAQLAKALWGVVDATERWAAEEGNSSYRHVAVYLRSEMLRAGMQRPEEKK